MQAALSVAGIRPSNSRRYPVQDIKDAIEDMYGVMPHVTCDGRGELSEVSSSRAGHTENMAHQALPQLGCTAIAAWCGTWTVLQVLERCSQ